MTKLYQQSQFQSNFDNFRYNFDQFQLKDWLKDWKSQLNDQKSQLKDQKSWFLLKKFIYFEKDELFWKSWFILKKLIYFEKVDLFWKIWFISKKSIKFDHFLCISFSFDQFWTFQLNMKWYNQFRRHNLELDDEIGSKKSHKGDSNPISNKFQA